MTVDADLPKNAAYWIGELASTEVGDVRWREAIEALRGLGHAAIPMLIEALGHEKPSVYIGAGNALTRRGATAFYDVRESLKHDNDRVRRNAALLFYGPALREDGLVVEAVSALIEALGDPDPDVRMWSAVALERIGEEAREAVPALLVVLDDEDSYNREWAAHALGSIGLAALEGIPKLTELLIDDEPSVRSAASHAIDRICWAKDEI